MKFYQFLCQFVKIRPRKTALDKPLYKLSAGRSMVEMLGVLAIIGVLSVGAISGYSKAMTKYKLNKQAEQISWLFNVMTTYTPQLKYNQWTNLITLFQKMNLIPDGMKVENGFLYDAMGNKVLISNNGGPTFLLTHIVYYLEPTSDNFTTCQNLLNVAKAHSQDFSHLFIGSSSGNDDHQYDFYFYGKTCNSSQKCITDITLDEIYSMCKSCMDKVTCSIDINWRL